MTATLTGVCRWRLECSEAATVEVVVASLGITTTACEEDARWHQAWSASTAVNRGPEPEPEEWCPDNLRGAPPEYCPAHGTPDQRGIEEVW